MADRENREDKKIRECLQEVYGCSDAQLLKELEQAGKSVSDSDFAGAEDRIFQKIMERKAAQEKKTETIEAARQEEIPKTEPVPEKKVVRFGKKRVFLAVALVAVFVGMLGVTAIGEKNYFFKSREKKHGIIFNSDKPIIKTEDLENAYEEAEKQLNIEIMKLGYIPETMDFKELHLSRGVATFEFNYEDNVVYFVQEKSQSELSLGVNSDRERVKTCVPNKWINKDIYINDEILDNGEQGYSAIVSIENVVYRLVGKIPEEEMVEIVKNFNLY